MESANTPHLTDEERAEVKETMLGLIGECRDCCYPLEYRVRMTAVAVRALIKLDAAGA